MLLSPGPESIYRYESPWSRLAEYTQLVAIDLLGFAKSERRDASPRSLAAEEFATQSTRTQFTFARLKPAFIAPWIRPCAAGLRAA